ncbi:ubiquinol-cytochrome C chaperone family protein [Elioraea thermophila]|uniref:ubiquinol-cytochrome C chaperone family protein n=1 Tax=Elioraea thermophila TaxID=2185104 RepID=UPI000DF49A80|nr:ubiquinol-cytochrome C chaperone family protein [Elioraea thermophila]
MLRRLFAPRAFEREGYLLYGAAVAAARDPLWYTRLAVPDTLEGRFDMVCLFTFLVLDRMTEEPGEEPRRLAQAVTDAMFADLDQTLRQMGAADTGLARRVRRLYEAFHGRSAAYARALASADDEPLAEALSRNVWRSESMVEGAKPLAVAVRRARAHLGAQGFDALRRGEVTLLAAEEALA